MSEEEYLLSLIKTLDFLVKNGGERITSSFAKESTLYVKNIKNTLPDLSHDEDWKKEQMALLEEVIYRCFKNDLLSNGVSGTIGFDNPTFINFLRSNQNS